MNQLVGLWRQYNPDDARGDDEITSTLAQQYPEQFTKFPDAVEDYGRIQKEVAEATKPTAGDYVKQGSGELLRGIPSALLTEPVEAMDVAARALQRKLPLPGIGVDSEFPFVHYKSPSEETESLQSGEGVLAKTAELSKDLTDKFTPEPVEGLQDNFLASTVPRTAGSIAGFMAGGGIAKALTKGAVKAVVEAAGEDALKEAAEAGFSKQYQNYVKDRAEKAVHSYAAGVLGAGSQAYGAYEDAKAKGASDDDAMKAYLANLPVGAAYALPIHELLPGGETGSKLGRIARDVGIGTGTMGAQQVASNLIAKGLYDPNRDLMAGVGEGAGAGAIVTAGLSALSHGLMGAEGAKKGERPTSNQEPTSNAEPVEPASPIDPVQQYEASPESVAKVQDVLQRQAAGETGPAIESALAGIYADPDLHALYTQEANSQATELKSKVDEAAAVADPAPTEAQKEAGNYQKGHVSIDGLDITIENAKGSTRSGTDADGKAWSVEMPAHYGYVKGTEGNDGDHVDVYIGEHPDSQKVWVVDQKDAQTGKFDEHKALLGFSNIHEAGMAYAKAFSDWKAKQRVGGVTELTMEQFKDWLKAGDHSKPLKKTGKPVESMSREEYAAHLAAHPEASESRGTTGFYRDLTKRPELRGKKGLVPTADEQTIIYGRVPEISKAIGDKDANEPWIHTEIGDSKTKNPDGSRSKLYITLRDWVADWTPEKVGKYVQLLRDNGFNGAVKTIGKAPFNADKLINQFDNVVTHARSEADIKIATKAARDVWGDRAALSTGLDGTNPRTAEHTSHTDLLAHAVAEAVASKQKIKLPPSSYEGPPSPITQPTSAPAPSVEVQAGAPVDPKPKISGPENGVGAPESYPDGAPTRTGKPAKPEPWRALSGKPEELSGKLAFESAQVASKEGGLGKKSAPAFVETADPKELYKDKTADANDRSKSRKLGVFMSPDGSHVLVGTAYENGGKQYVTAFDANGKPKATQIGKLTEAGYRLVAALKTNEPTKGYAVTYSAPEWAKASEELRAKAGEVRSGGVAPVPEAVATELVGSSESRGGSVVKSPNASPYEMRGGAGKVEPELLGKLVDAIGEPRWDNQEEAHEQITDGFSELPVAQQTKLLDAFSPKDGRSGEVDYVEGFERLKESLYEHFESKLDLPTQPAKEAVTNPVDTGAEKGRVPNPAPVPAAGAGDTNAGPGGGQPSGAGSGAGTQGGANTSERLSQRSARGGVSSSPELRARWNSVLDAARANGLDVSVLQAMPGMREGGVWRPGEAVLTVVDALNPSHDNIVLALHELAGHPVFDRLPEAQKQMMYRAFDAMAGQADMPEGFTPVIKEGANVREVTAEEVLVERASRSLAAEGFDPASARGIAQRVVRMLKTIALRAYMVLQKATLGYVTPELAQSYFEERMRSFLSDGPAPMSFLSWMGGPRLKVEQRAETFSARGGSGAMAASFDYERGSMAIREVLPETMSALRFNSAVAADDKARFSERPAGTAFVQTNDPHEISRDLNSPEKVKEDVGAYNALHDAHQAAFKAFGKLDQSGLSFEQFVAAFTNSDVPATEKIEARNKELQANGFEPVDPTLRPHDLLSEASQMQAADKGLQYLWSLREHWSTRRKESESFLKGEQETLSRNNQRLHELLKRYTDMDLQFSNARDELKGIHGEWVRDLKAGIGNGRKEGVLSQVIRELDGSPTLPKQYERVINRLYSQLTGDNTGKFVDTLQRIAQLDIDWKNVKARDAAELIAKMVAPTDPSLKQLENRGMAGLVVAFAKSNEHVMEFLKIARSDAMEERAKLNEILKGAVSDARDAVTKAKELARKLPRLAVSADRLLTKLEELKAQNHAHIDEMQRARTFIDLHTDALPGLQNGMVQLERMIGAKGLSWEPNDGAKYLVALPARGNVPVFSEKVLKLAGVEGSDEVRQAVAANNAWLNSVPEDKRGADWNSLREMTTKLEQVAAIAGHELVVKRSVVNMFFGSLVDKLESLGLPTAKAAAMRMRRYLAERHAGGADADVLGGKWKSAEGKAMEALGLKGAGEEKFQRLVFQSALSFAEKNPDVLAGRATGKEAFEALLPKLRDYLARDPDMAQRLNKPGAWPALENYYRRTYESMEYVNNFRKKLGAKIRETGPDGFSIEREPIGSTFFTAMRRISKDAVRMYHDMRDLGWLGSYPDGATGQKLRADWVTKEYAADRDGFEQQVQQLFTPDVWREFVQPLVETDGRASFYGPKGVDGLTPLALRENVKRAFAAAEGSPVKFAEALYELESHDGASVEEGQPEFVGRTMQAFQEFFDSIHNTQKDYDNNLRQGMPTPGRVLQDARISESWPGAWMDYQTYGRFEMHEMVNALAAHGSFGRDLAGMRKDMAATESALARKAEVFRKIANEVTDANPGKKGAGLQRLIQQAVQRQGHSYMDLKQSARNLQSARYEHRQFEALMKSQGGLALELQPFTELVGAIAGATVQGPGTALVHFGNFGQQFQKLGLGGAAMSVLRSSLKGFAAEQFGTLAQLFHGQIAWNAERNARRVRNGYVDPDARRKFEDAWAGMVHDRVSALNPMLRGVFKAARAVRTLTSTGLGRAAEGSDNAYPTLKPQALFTQLAQHMSAGFIDGWTSGFEDMVERGVKYFQDPAHAGDHADPAFRFENMTDLGYTKGFMGIGNDERAFKYFYDALGRYGMSLEKVARDVTAARERDPKAPALNDDQFRVLASVVANEVTLDANPATRPSAIYTNPLLRVSAPLLGWSVAKTHDNWEAFRNPDMTQTSRNAFKAFTTGLLPYTALVPIGIALGLMRDKYNEVVLNKKANREDPTSFGGVVDSLSWVGNLGLAGDVFNSLLNRDTQRPFDVDNRVLFMSSLLNVKSALQNWYEQGSADYATVYRPLTQALGGSGYLQYWQILNNAMSLDNVEARVTARINVSNFLRVAGRELGMDVKGTAGAGEVMSTPMRPLIGQMVMSAYANDSGAFREAYMQALALARGMKEPDPQKYIAQKFGGYNPLKSVFKTEPSTLEYQKLLNTLDPDGQLAVSNALRMFNAYATQIGGRASFGTEKKVTPFVAARMGERQAFNLQDARRMATSY